jgi:hypothetical protein
MKHECLLPFSLEKVYLTNIPYLGLAFPDPNLLRHQFLEYIPFEKIEEIYKEKDQLSKLSKLKLDQFISSADLYFNFPLNPRYFLTGSVVFYDQEDKTIYFIEKPFLKEGMEFSKTSMIEILMPKEKTPRKVKTYPLFDWLFTSYKYIDENKTLFTQVKKLTF